MLTQHRFWLDTLLRVDAQWRCVELGPGSAELARLCILNMHLHQGCIFASLWLGRKLLYCHWLQPTQAWGLKVFWWSPQKWGLQGYDWIVFQVARWGCYGTRCVWSYFERFDVKENRNQYLWDKWLIKQHIKIWSDTCARNKGTSKGIPMGSES